MIKLISFFKRKQGMDVEEFQRYWSTGHAELGAKVAGNRRYVQCHTLLSAYQKGREPDYDGTAISWFEDTEAIKRAAKTQAYIDLRADERNFIDLSTMGWIYCREHVIKDGPISKDGVKTLIFVNKRPEWEVRAFQKYWLEEHGPLGAAVPGFQRYVQNHTLLSYYDSGQIPKYDGVVEAWFKDTQAIREATSSPQHALDQEDANKFMDVSKAPFLITREHVVVP